MRRCSRYFRGIGASRALGDENVEIRRRASAAIAFTALRLSSKIFFTPSLQVHCQTVPSLCECTKDVPRNQLAGDGVRRLLECDIQRLLSNALDTSAAFPWIHTLASGNGNIRGWGLRTLAILTQGCLDRFVVPAVLCIEKLVHRTRSESPDEP